MKNYAILNWKTGELMDYSFKAVSVENVYVYEDADEAKMEIESRGEPFCKVIEVSELEAELHKTEAYNNLGGVSLYSLKYGQKFKVLQKGWEGKTFVFQAKKEQQKEDRIFLYDENGNKTGISGATAHALKVEVIL
jgi:hypothetical protein